MPKSGNSEAARIHWLRQYASYLTPRLGFFGSDNLLFVVTYFHQLFLNVLLIALAFAVLLLYPRAILLLLKTIYQSPVAFEISSTFGAASALTGLFLIALYLFPEQDTRTQALTQGATWTFDTFSLGDSSGAECIPRLR